jgi:hypothetical protein
MSTVSLDKKILPTLKNLMIARTNAGIWVRILLTVVVANIIGIALSLLFFSNVRGIGNRIIESPTLLPKAKEIDKAHIHEVLAAFAGRVTMFDARLRDGVSISDPY